MFPSRPFLVVVLRLSDILSCRVFVMIIIHFFLSAFRGRHVLSCSILIHQPFDFLGGCDRRLGPELSLFIFLGRRLPSLSFQSRLR